MRALKPYFITALVCISISFLIALLSPLCTVLEAQMKRAVVKRLDREGVEIIVSRAEYSGFLSYKFESLAVKLKPSDLDIEVDDFCANISKTGFLFGFSDFSIRLKDDIIKSNEEGASSVAIEFDKHLRLVKMDVDIDDLYALTSSGLEAYLSSVHSSSDRAISIRTATIINPADEKFKKTESNYIDLALDYFDARNMELDGCISFRFLPLQYDNSGVDFYDTAIDVEVRKSSLNISLKTSSFDIKNDENVLLTLDDAHLDVKNPDVLKPSFFKIDFTSNILNIQADADMDAKKLTAKMSFVRSEGISAEGSVDFSIPGRPIANANFGIDTRVSGFDLKGSASASLDGDRLFVSGNGLDAGEFKFVPYADFSIQSANKSVYVDVSYKSQPYCMFKLDFSGGDTQFITVVFPHYNYPIKVTGLRRRFELESPGKLDVSIDYFNSLKFDAKLNEFFIPLKLFGQKEVQDIKLNLSLLMDIAKGDIKIDPSYVDIKAGEYFFSTDFSFNNNFLSLDKVVFSDQQSVWNAYATFVIPQSLDIKDMGCSISAFQMNGDGRLIFNASRNSGFTDIVFKANEVSASFLRALGVSYVDANINLRTDFKTIKFASGNLQTRGLDGEQILSGDINFENGNINLSDAFFKYKGIKVRNSKLSFDSENMLFELMGNVQGGFWRFDGTLPIKSDVHLTMRIGGYDPAQSDRTLIGDITSILKSDIHIDGLLNLQNTYFDDLRFDDIFSTIIFKDNIIKLTGGQLTGRIDLSNPASISADVKLIGENFPLSGSFSFAKKAEKYAVSADIYRLSSDLMTKLMVNPIITFYSGNVKGWLDVELEGTDVDMKCSLYSSQLVLSTFWLENERFTVSDLVITADGRELKLSTGSAVSLNRLTGRISPLDSFSAGMYFEQGDLMPHWYFDILLPPSSALQANMPIIPMNYTIDIGKANGRFTMNGRGMGDMLITGDLFVDDVTMSIPSRAPWWFVTVDEDTGEQHMTFVAPVDFDGIIRVGKNVSFSYPNPNNALVNAVLKEGQSARVTYIDKTQSVNIDSDVEIERGEVFYFNKKFIIESGSFSWPGKDPTDFLDIKGENMKINLLASLREFDKNGNSTDLYISLKDASIDNLNPSFSASVPMEQNEVIYRFGQSIYNTQSANTREENFANSASLLMDMALAVGTLRGVGSFSLGSNFANKLGVDVWTFRSQMISSFLAETSLSIMNNSYKLSENTFSRLIDKTSVNIAKKINNEMILSLQLELRSIADPLVKNKGVEIMPNFYCGMNLSLDWITPMARIMLLSRPEDFSLPGLLSGIGMSISKSVNF